MAELANTKTNVDAKNPSGYYYRRISAWMTMQTPPMSNEMGISELKSPSKFDKRRLLAAQNSGTHLSVVMESEALIERFPLWLDANIISFRSLSTMESSYSTASTAILSLLSDLLRRFPDLRHTRFSDGEPMFGLECQSMQAYLIQDKEEFSVGELQPSTSGSGEIVKSEVESTTKTHKNTSSTQVDLRLHDNHRLRCQLLMDQIENCIANNNYDLALAQFSYLWDQLSEINFFTWDPGMAAKLSERHISTILAKHGDKSELNEKEIAQCRKLFQYLSVTNISKASKITVSKFI